MSRHQYIRNLDYQDAVNEYEGYSEEEDELSPEDRALMNQGIADVQAALGVEASKVTVTQIEEALWHYYYDLDKTVAYLISKFVNPRPKATKPAAQPPNGKFAIRANHTAAAVLPLELGMPVDWARKSLDQTNAAPPPPQSYPASSRATRPLAAPSFSLFFRDMPWGNIPKHRETTFIPPSMPRGGLLGGAGAPPKMSKLQALAAARKKKLEEGSAVNNKVDRARADLNELSIQDTHAGKENIPLAESASKRLKTSEFPRGGAVPIFATKPAPSEPSQGAHVVAEASASAQALLGLPTLKPSAPEDEPPVADPSAFASVLFGLPSNALKLKAHKDEAPAPEAEAPVRVEVDFSGPLYGYDGQGQPPEEPSAGLDWFDIRKRRRDDSGGYEEVVVLFPNLPESAREAFTQPSPDDIVLAAQAKARPKGSLLNKSKR
jgi:elongation factor 1 alpha-like protein